MKNIYLFQPQYSVEVRNEDTYWLPYSVGCLWSYCSQFEDITENYELKDIIFKREYPENILERLEEPYLCAFSCYVWNERYCLIIARMIKEKFPNCIIEFGGPQATIKMKLENEFIDCVMLGEGEQDFFDLLITLKNNEPIKSVYERNRIDQLDFPSPYEAGIFNTLVQKNPDVLWATVLETNRGCPHRCTFCDWGGTTTSKVKLFNLERVQNDLDWITHNNVAFLMLTDANFGMYRERDVEIAKLLKEAAMHPDSVIENIVPQFTKNSTEIIFDIAKILGRHCRYGVSVAVQSMNQPTLKAIKRKNLHVNNIKSHMELSAEYGIRTYTELILGLPEETLETWKDGICKLLECGQHDSIDVWFCQVFGNTELNSEFSRNLYGIKTIKAEDYVSFTNTKDCADIKEMVEIINETNCMTTDELIEARMYAWMIIQFHVNGGYSQLIAKYYHNKLGITYRQFYDVLFEIIKNDNGVFGTHYMEMKKSQKNYMTTGKLLKEKTGHELEINFSSEFDLFWNNKQTIFKLIENCAAQFGDINFELFDIQSKFVYDQDTKYPIQISSSFNLTTWEDGRTEYIITTDLLEHERNDLWIIRKLGLIKNKIIKK
jgi:putative methyltransferase